MAIRAFGYLLVSTVLASGGLFAQAAKKTTAQTDAQGQVIDQLCGHLELSAPKKKYIVVNGKPETRLYTAHLEGATVSLFSTSSADHHCCKRKPLATARSTKYGRFEITGVQRGAYWLKIQRGGLLRAIPVRVTDDFDERKCHAPSVIRSVVVDSDPPKIETRIRNDCSPHALKALIQLAMFIRPVFRVRQYWLTRIQTF